MESSLMEVIGTDRKSNWLARLLRLLTLRRLTDPGAMAGDASIAFCAGMALAAWLIVDRLQWGPGVEFDSFGISMLALAALLGLALAYVMARLSRPLLPMRYTLLFVVAPLPLLIAADALLGMWLTERWDALTWALLAVCLLVYAARALRAVSGKLQIRAVLAAAALLAAYFWLGQRIDLRPTFWAPPDNVDAPDAAMSPQIAEALLFEQRDRLDEALQAVADSGTDPSRSSVFFVGFAGVASQKVFAEEIKLAARVVGQRFDSSERQLLLINDHRDFDSYPLATVSGLRYALGEIAKKMNIERDILFLSLSSHGSDEPLLSVSNGVLPLEQVSGENLASALRDPDTVLITAAAADRTSFGCSDDRDLTYFGEAFYRDALPRAKTLRDAFALTREAIAKRELDEHVTASEPQAFFGERIERLLSRQAIRAPAP